jgi:hypothetical protein
VRTLAPAADVAWIVVAAGPITDIGATAAETLRDLDAELGQAGTGLAFAQLKDAVRDRLAGTASTTRSATIASPDARRCPRDLPARDRGRRAELTGPPARARRRPRTLTAGVTLGQAVDRGGRPVRGGQWRGDLEAAIGPVATWVIAIFMAAQGRASSASSSWPTL